MTKASGSICGVKRLRLLANHSGMPQHLADLYPQPVQLETEVQLELDAISQDLSCPQQVALPPAHRLTAPDAVPCTVPPAGGSMRCRPLCRQRPPVTCDGWW